MRSSQRRRQDKVKTNIILIGMPGAGKSTVGVILAKLLGMSFLDGDIAIQEQTGKRLSELLADCGMEGFVELEGRINQGLYLENTVLATGGSAVLHEGAMRHLKELGEVVYLFLEYENLAERIGDLFERGVVCRKGQTLLDVYRERIPLYERYADIVICERECCGSVRETAEEIRRRI